MSGTADSLEAALARHGIEVADVQRRMLQRYCAALWEWNAKINLTRHVDYERFVARDVVDSLVFAEFMRSGEKILDVGTGGGVPGVVLAILRADLDVVVCESVAKKARAVGEIVGGLGLEVRVLHGRAEDILAEHKYDTLVIRAVARLRKLLEWFRPRWESFDRMLVLKGPGWVDERGEARHYGLLRGLALRRLRSYPIPGTDSESVLLEITRKG